jgi:hypothetical protein
MKKVTLLFLSLVMSIFVSCSKDDTTVLPEPLPTPLAPEITTFSQTTISGTPLIPRRQHQVLSYNNKLWIIGGYNDPDSARLNDVLSSSDGGVTWTQVTISGTHFSPRSLHEALVFNNKMWVIGGYTDTTIAKDVWSSTDGAHWTLETANAQFNGRFDFGVVVFNNKMWLIGGQDGSAYKNDIWTSTDGVQWTQVTTTGAIFAPREGHEVVVFNNKLYVIGGSIGPSYPNDVWSSSDGISWTQETTSGPIFSGRIGHQSIVHNNRLYVIGGYGTLTGYSNEVWSSTNGKDWANLSLTNVFSARREHQALVFNNKICVMGGIGNSDFNDVWFSN